MTNLKAVRARFAQRGAPLCGGFDRSQHPGRSPRTGRHVSGPSIHPGHDHVGLPESGAQRRPKLPRYRVTDHRASCGQRPPGLLTQYVQLLHGAEPSSDQVRPHLGHTNRGGVAEQRCPRLEVERPNPCTSPMGQPSPCRTRQRIKRCTPSRPINSRDSAFRWPESWPSSLWRQAHVSLEIMPSEGKGTGEKNLFRRMYKTFKPGDVVLLDSLFDDYFLAYESRQLGVHLVAHPKYARPGSQLRQSEPRARSSFGSVPTSRANDPREIPESSRETRHAARDRARPQETASSNSKSSPRFSTCRSTASRSAICTTAVGKAKLI